MSASSSSESPETKVEKNAENSQNIDSNYALYLFSNNKHACSPDRGFTQKENVNTLKTDTKTDFEQPSVCLSLLEGNLGAELETVVRCYLLKTLSSREDLSFENEGKYAALQFSEDPDKSFGCYYHRLSKQSNSEKTEDETSKVHTFFICLIGPANGIMESYCIELGKFCFNLIPLLDPEGLKNIDEVKVRLKSWYSHCIDYIGRCIQRFKEDLAILLHCSLWGNVEVVCDDDDVRWDIERFLETSSLLPKGLEDSKESILTSCINLPLSIKIIGDKIKPNKSLDDSPYCIKWFEKLRNCNREDRIALHNILDGFRLKTIQDLNTLKRFLQKAQTDHYSLYKAFLFLQASGYEDILLYHVKREGHMAGEQDGLEIISCLQDFLKCKQSLSLSSEK